MTQAPPVGWGKDALTDYLETHRGNQFATFDNKRPAMADLIKIDEMFNRFLHGAINPRPFYPVGFMLRAHSAFRAGVCAVMAGQLFESQAILRLCLEHAAYGFYIGADQDRMKRWLLRGESNENRKAVQKEFRNEKIKQYIKSAAPVMGAQFAHLYNQLIDFGAHPNENGYLISTNIEKNEDGGVEFQTVYLHADGPQLDIGLKTAGQIGLWTLHLTQLLFRERYELLGIRADLEIVRKHF